ncbi:hypothetical protein O181_038802 [Austropuccinia psidii MF-1]|uniref:Reverse transcriptase Ty1/copia-type domain-containing protein n=1 Tax=Austropuccinia psidii MF-1 TaxID=1389203 RepID=A0A9Q3DBM5_9BASI|nr:hypothetical protein [Austropuccinia psidii MF-1]
MKDLGRADLLLGIKILPKKCGFSLSQEHSIANIAETFNLIYLALAKTPPKPGLKLTKASEAEVRAFRNLGLNYRSIIGALNYISTKTRPDIAFAISHLSKFPEPPSLNHWVASLQALFYLYHTRKITLKYYNKGKSNIITYSDLDLGNLLINRRSIGG